MSYIEDNNLEGEYHNWKINGDKSEDNTNPTPEQYLAERQDELKKFYPAEIGGKSLLKLNGLLTQTAERYAELKMEKVNEIVNSPAFRHLQNGQFQIDEDGTNIGVSRQALDEVLAALSAVIALFKK